MLILPVISTKAGIQAVTLGANGIQRRITGQASDAL